MVAQLQVDYITSKTVYFLLRNSSAQIWNTSSNAFENFSAGSYANYSIPATEQGSTGYYTAAVPTSLTDTYSVVAKDQVGGSAAQGDLTAGTGNYLVVAGIDLTQALRYVGATTAGKIVTAGKPVEKFLDFANVDAIDVTVDSNGNRTSITYN